ncbi:MAG: exopolyphosphatase [Deltaproteobacteria bacterium]|nr:exopolyphosphatase [Deltaproteobacteria bacterium]
MRIVTRPDFDGIVCAVLLYAAENIDTPVKWVSPNDMQKCRVDIRRGDIIANLPYNEKCSLWFDHHFSNKLRHAVPGSFRIAPSAAGIIFEYYRNRLTHDYADLVRETDKIDAAQLTVDEIRHPERYPYILLSMTIHPHLEHEKPYWNRLVGLLRSRTIDEVLDDTEVRKRCDEAISENKTYRALLQKYTATRRHVAITDFRPLGQTPYGNRFLVYSMFPETSVNVKIGYEEADRETVVVKVGHSILNRTCNVNVGQMLSYFEGGGHKGAGACRFRHDLSNQYLPQIIDILMENDPDGGLVAKTQRSGHDRRRCGDRRKSRSAAWSESGKTERRKGSDRRTAGEQRAGWERTDRWQSRPVVE